MKYKKYLLYSLGVFLSWVIFSLPCSAAIVRDNISSFENTDTATSTVSNTYDSGTSGTHRYAIFVIQPILTQADVVTGVTYDGVQATLLAKRHLPGAQGQPYNYIYGLPEPTTGTHDLVITGSQDFKTYVFAATYSGVNPSGSGSTGDRSTTGRSSWTIDLETTAPGEVAIISSEDNFGGMTAGENTEKLTTWASSYGQHVFQGGPYENPGTNSFTLVGDDGGAHDVTYVTLLPYGVEPEPSGIVRHDVSSFENTDVASSTISDVYDSGTSGTHRYAVFVIQPILTQADVVTGVTYDGVPATLLAKRQLTNAQNQPFNYIYGLPNPATGTHDLVITGSESFKTYVVAATYSGVNPNQPGSSAGLGVGESDLGLSVDLEMEYPGEVVIISSEDNFGSMLAGANTEKLTTWASTYGQQVFQGGPYENVGMNRFTLLGPNGGGHDVTYVALIPFGFDLGVIRGNVSSFENTDVASSTISDVYDSGTSGTHRYAVFVIQPILTQADVVTGVTYDGVQATLLAKRHLPGAQGRPYNYIYGLPEPTTGTHDLVITGSQDFKTYVFAATYSGVNPSGPGSTGDASTSGQSSWTIDLETTAPGEVAIISSEDNSGSMVAGANTERLAAWPFSYGQQVFQGGPYENPGTNSFTLVGDDGGAHDVTYATLLPYEPTTTVVELTSIPTFVDSATINGPSESLTISKTFTATGTSYGGSLFYIFQADAEYAVNSVTWNGNAMTLVSASDSFGGVKSYVFGYENPEIGESYDAVATMNSGGIIYTGTILYYEREIIEQ